MACAPIPGAAWRGAGGACPAVRALQRDGGSDATMSTTPSTSSTPYGPTIE
ncbi:hypothetical protein [Actinomadura sp. J1-007]|uniref:hypothetical protein n=1 Tax=Actinomadura sp. J1-007 TaxID=2661913 RepID=UPI0013689AC1|nr:hypothetical protein [Actinomadura sp. J1-007]